MLFPLFASFEATLPANQQDLWFTALGAVAAFVLALLKPKFPMLASIIDGLMGLFVKKPAPAPVVPPVDPSLPAPSPSDHPLLDAFRKLLNDMLSRREEQDRQFAAAVASVGDRAKPA